MDPATPSINHQISERDRKKAEDAAKREADAAAKALDKSLRAALKEDPPSAEATALLAQHAAEAERIRTSIAQAERRKQQAAAGQAARDAEEARYKQSAKDLDAMKKNTAARTDHDLLDDPV